MPGMGAPAAMRDDATLLRRFTVDDAAAVAAAVRESMEHLAAWLPWADDASATIAFQRQRLQETVRGYRDDHGSWEYAICTLDGTVVGSCGIIVRDDGRREIGYWVHANHVGGGHATRAARLLTDLWRDVRDEPRVEIRCDEANAASASIPRKLGYELEAVVDEPAEAKSESGRTMVWVLNRAREI
jgi:RimJ/RimL family protein N-acetyltransferase